MILEGEIKDAKMSSFSSDFQTRIKHSFPLYFHHELLMSLRSLKAKVTIASSVPKKNENSISYLPLVIQRT